jgi:hypothetical protein
MMRSHIKRTHSWTTKDADSTQCHLWEFDDGSVITEFQGIYTRNAPGIQEVLDRDVDLDFGDTIPNPYILYVEAYEAFQYATRYLEEWNDEKMPGDN